MKRAVDSKYLIFKGYSIEDFEYKFEKITEQKEFKYKVLYDYAFQVSDREVNSGILEYTLKIMAHSEDKEFLIVSLLLKGFFATEEKVDHKEFVERLFDVGLPNMFQIARAIIASFTSLTGNSPLIIPLMDLSIKGG